LNVRRRGGIGARRIPRDCAAAGQQRNQRYCKNDATHVRLSLKVLQSLTGDLGQEYEGNEAVRRASFTQDDSAPSAVQNHARSACRRHAIGADGETGAGHGHLDETGDALIELSIRCEQFYGRSYRGRNWDP
jgi:hypothetical protein